MPLFLSDDEVARLLPMDECIAAVEQAFRLHGLGQADNRPRNRSPLAAYALRALSGAIPGMGLGLKAYSVGAAGLRFLVTVTKATEPLFDGAWVKPGTHINAVGSALPHARELDAVTVRRATRVAADDRAQTMVEAGDLIAAVREGALRWDDVVELGQIVAGKVAGRTSPDDITLFESQGIAIEDIAAASVVYRNALSAGAGRPLPDTVLG